YYIQYAHARIASVFRQLTDKGLDFDRKAADMGRLDSEYEQRLITALSRYPDLVASAAADAAVQSVAHYLRDTADAFHSYYNAQKFVIEDTGLRNARLALIAATRQVIANGLALLGVSAPNRM